MFKLSLKNSCYGYLLRDILSKILYRDIFHRRLKISNRGSLLLKTKEVYGGGNFLSIGKNSLVYKYILRIRGNNNKIIIGDNCKLGYNCKIYVIGDNCELIIGSGSTFSHDVELLVQENNSKVIIGEDCMFSHHINVRTSDAHPVFDIIMGSRSNYAKNVKIGNHVWLTPECIVQKGCSIGDGAIVATRSIVTKDIPKNVLAAGIPAKIIKQNVSWGRKIKD